MTGYRPTAKCPSCGRRPPVQFSEAEVQRAKRERQSARVLSVSCPRCGARNWLHARDIANAERVPEPEQKKRPRKRRRKRGVDATTPDAVR